MRDARNNLKEKYDDWTKNTQFSTLPEMAKVALIVSKAFDQYREALRYARRYDPKTQAAINKAHKLTDDAIAAMEKQMIINVLAS
jgi:hypothetical protein